jgi:hypothetical protein
MKSFLVQHVSCTKLSVQKTFSITKLSDPKTFLTSQPFSAFFALIRPFLGYFILMYPNGQPWFTQFICYASMYIDLNRCKSILTQTWEAFDDITPFRGTLEESPLRPPDLDPKDFFELRFNWTFAKLTNKQVTVPQKFLGRIDKEDLVESPNSVMWLDMLLREQFGIGLLRLRTEKRADSPRWNTIKTSYMFPGARKSPTYTSELANMHLRMIMTFLGFADRIVGMSNCHSSFRGGGASGGEVNVRQGKLGNPSSCKLCAVVTHSVFPFTFPQAASTPP